MSKWVSCKSTNSYTQLLPHLGLLELVCYAFFGNISCLSDLCRSLGVLGGCSKA
jgi:hypothetical protein